MWLLAAAVRTRAAAPVKIRHLEHLVELAIAIQTEKNVLGHTARLPATIIALPGCIEHQNPVLHPYAQVVHAAASLLPWLAKTQYGLISAIRPQLRLAFPLRDNCNRLLSNYHGTLLGLGHQDAECIARFEPRCLRLEMAHKIWQAVSINVLSSRIAKCEALLFARRPKCQRCDVDAGHRVERCR